MRNIVFCDFPYVNIKSSSVSVSSSHSNDITSFIATDSSTTSRRGKMLTAGQFKIRIKINGKYVRMTSSLVHSTLLVIHAIRILEDI